MKASAMQNDLERPEETRFEFGANWTAFLRNVSPSVVERARNSFEDLVDMDLQDRTVIDVGCGSGLFSLAARQLGARVVSFDYDAQCVACTSELKRRYCGEDPDWQILQGSILDRAFVESLGTFDLVYSWGVLHHTGAMWDALRNTTELATDGGRVIVALYNDQGRTSVRWTRIKRMYNRLPRILRPPVLWLSLARIWGPTTVRDLLRGRPFATWRNYSEESRGMSPWYDLVDWVGGYPFEVARPDEVIDFGLRHGLVLRRSRTCGTGRGCNEFVFDRC